MKLLKPVRVTKSISLTGSESLIFAFNLKEGKLLACPVLGYTSERGGCYDGRQHGVLVRCSPAYDVYHGSAEPDVLWVNTSARWVVYGYDMNIPYKNRTLEEYLLQVKRAYPDLIEVTVDGLIKLYGA